MLGTLTTLIPAKMINKVLIFFAVFSAIALVIFFAYRHYTNLVHEVVTLTKEAEGLAAFNNTLIANIDAHARIINKQETVIEEWKKHNEKIKVEMQRWQTAYTKASAETKRLHAIFSKHNLGKIARRKPTLLERRINAGSRRIGRMLENASDFKQRLSAGTAQDSRDRKATGTDPPAVAETDKVE